MTQGFSRFHSSTAFFVTLPAKPPRTTAISCTGKEPGLDLQCGQFVRHSAGSSWNGYPKGQGLGLRSSPTASQSGSGTARQGHRRERRRTRRPFRRDAVHRRAFRQRQDHLAQHDFRHPAAQCRQGEVKGADIWTLNKDQLADFRLNTIGFVFQDYHLFPRLTTAENVAIPLILKQPRLGRVDRRGEQIPRNRRA